MHYIDTAFSIREYVFLMFGMFILFLITMLVIHYIPPKHTRNDTTERHHGMDTTGKPIVTTFTTKKTTVDPKTIKRIISDYKKVGFTFPSEIHQHINHFTSEDDIHGYLQDYISKPKSRIQ